jgi:hypothetical protein
VARVARKLTLTTSEECWLVGWLVGRWCPFLRLRQKLLLTFVLSAVFQERVGRGNGPRRRRWKAQSCLLSQTLAFTTLGSPTVGNTDPESGGGVADDYDGRDVVARRLPRDLATQLYFLFLIRSWIHGIANVHHFTWLSFSSATLLVILCFVMAPITPFYVQ